MAALIVERHGPAMQLGGAEEHCHPLVPRGPRPGGVGGARRGDRALDLGRAALLDIGEHVRARWGITASNVVPVSTRSPPITIGMWTRSADISREPLLKLRALGRARRVALDRLVDRSGRTEDAGGAHSGDCILDGVRVTRHPYDVPGWGVGEVWVRDGVVDPARARVGPRREHEAAADAGRDAGERLGRQTVAAGPAAIRRAILLPLGSEAPSANATGQASRVVPTSCRICAGGLRAPAGVPTSYDDVPLDLDWATPLQQRARRGGAGDSLG